MRYKNRHKQSDDKILEELASLRAEVARLRDELALHKPYPSPWVQQPVWIQPQPTYIPPAPFPSLPWKPPMYETSGTFICGTSKPFQQELNGAGWVSFGGDTNKGQ